MSNQGEGGGGNKICENLRTMGNEDPSSWYLVEGGELKGAVIILDENGEAVSLSSKSCRDIDRWEIMPSVASYSFSLRVLDLHKARYMSSLHDSICSMKNLRILTLSQCDRLVVLPENLGALESLEEVREL
jgi:hypothetical protein